MQQTLSTLNLLLTKIMKTDKIEFEFRFLAAGDHESEHKKILSKEIRCVVNDSVVNRAGITADDILNWSADAGTMKFHSDCEGWHYDVKVVVNLKAEMEVNDIGRIPWKWGGH